MVAQLWRRGHVQKRVELRSRGDLVDWQQVPVDVEGRPHVAVADVGLDLLGLRPAAMR